VLPALVLLAAGCPTMVGDANRDGSETPPDAASPDALPDSGIARVLRLDSVEELSGRDVRLSDAVIEPWGAIGPAPRLTGVLLARGTDEMLFSNPKAARWDDLAAARTTGVGVTTLAPFTAGVPPGVGLDDGDECWTWWAEGELFVSRGAQEWGLEADGAGFFDLAAPGERDFRRAITAVAGDGLQVVPLQADVTGWYRIRIAVADDQGASAIRLLNNPPGGPGLRPIERTRLRAQAGDLAGLIAEGFDDAHVLDPRGVALFGGGLDIDLGTGVPADLGLGNDRAFSVRWSGQLRIDVAGDYRFDARGDDGYRLWLGGQLVLDALTGGGPQVTPPIALDAGWHDLVVDLSNSAGPASLRVGVDTGPELAGMAIPRGRLRPAVGRSERLAAVSDDRSRDLPAQGESSVPLTVAAPAGARVTRVDVSVTAGHPRWSDLELAVQAPDGREAVVLPAGGAVRAGTFTERRSSNAVAGGPAAGPWRLVVRDRGTGGSGNVQGAAITVHYHGGEPAVALSGSYESRVYDLGAVLALDRVSWTARARPGTEARVMLRTCDAPGACATQPWSDPQLPDQAPDVPVRRYLQLRLEVRTAGDHVPSLDWVQVDYRVSE